MELTQERHLKPVPSEMPGEYVIYNAAERGYYARRYNATSRVWTGNVFHARTYKSEAQAARVCAWLATLGYEKEDISIEDKP